jgi:hypothetical protein
MDFYVDREDLDHLPFEEVVRRRVSVPPERSGKKLKKKKFTQNKQA